MSGQIFARQDLDRLSGQIDPEVSSGAGTPEPVYSHMTS